jgi:transposase
MYAMEDLGISVIATSQGIDTTTAIGRMAADLYATISEEEWKLIRDRMNGGRQMKAEAGGYIGGPPPFGLHVVGKGTPGSYLERDELEMAILDQAARLSIDGLADSETGHILNAQGYTDRLGRPWDRKSVRRILTSEATLLGTTTFRKTEPRDHGKPHTKLGEDGRPLFGRTVVITLPETLKPDVRTALRDARSLRRREVSPRRWQTPFILSARIIGSCGKTYCGGNLDPIRTYRCRGVDHLCGDPTIVADAVEEVAWKAVVSLLSDSGQMSELVKHWMMSLPKDHDTYAGRAEELRSKILTLDRSLGRAVRLEVETDDETIAQSARALQRELAADLKERQADLVHVEDWLRDYEQSRSEILQLRELATTAQSRLHELGPVQKKMLFKALDVEVHVLDGEFRRKVGRKCPVLAWHLDSETPVPDDASPEDWEAVRALLLERHGYRHLAKLKDPRNALNAVLFKLRTATTWESMPAMYQPWRPPYIKMLAWWKEGDWPLIVELLNRRGGGSPAAVWPDLPALKIRGRLSLDLATTDLESDEASGSASIAKKAVPHARDSTPSGPR